MAQTMAFSTNHDRVYRDQAICAPYKQINGELVYLNFNKRSYRESGFASIRPGTAPRVTLPTLHLHLHLGGVGSKIPTLRCGRLSTAPHEGNPEVRKL